LLRYAPGNRSSPREVRGNGYRKIKKYLHGSEINLKTINKLKTIKTGMNSRLLRPETQHKNPDHTY